MLLFSKRAKYRIYTFVIKDSMLQEINASHLQKVLIKKERLANISCKTTNIHKIQRANFHKGWEHSELSSTFHTTYRNMVSTGVHLCSLTKETGTFCHYSQNSGAQRRTVR